MEFTKPTVSIDLDEYNELLKIKALNGLTPQEHSDIINEVYLHKRDNKMGHSFIFKSPYTSATIQVNIIQDYHYDCGFDFKKLTEDEIRAINSGSGQIADNDDLPF